MFDIDKYMCKPFFERDCRPEPPCDFGPHHHHEKPRFTMTEEVEHTARLMRETIDRLLRFEERVKREVTDLAKNVSSDNVIFKNAMHESWTTFLMEVKNEINVFEANVNSDLALFKSDIETDYATFADTINERLATFEQTYEAGMTELKQSIQNQYNSFIEAVNERIDGYNVSTAQAMADYQRQLTTALNTFEQTMNAQYNNFTESIGNSMHEFRTHWEQIITERLAAQDGRISDAEMYMKTNLEANIRTLIGDMHANGGFTQIIEGEVFNDLERKIDGFKRLNVKYFGASGDGETDDTNAIKLAIEATKSVNGCLYFPCGTYCYTDLGNLAVDNLKIEGEHEKYTVLKCVNTTNAHVAFNLNRFENLDDKTFAYGLSISNLTVIGNSKTETVFDIRGVSRSEFRNLTGGECAGTVFNVGSCMANLFERVRTKSVEDVAIINTPEYGLILNDVTRGTIMGGKPTNNSFTNCYFENTANGVHIIYADECIFIACAFQANDESGVVLEKDSCKCLFECCGIEHNGTGERDYIDGGRGNVFRNGYVQYVTELNGVQCAFEHSYTDTIKIMGLCCVVDSSRVRYHGNAVKNFFIDTGEGTQVNNVFDVAANVMVYPTHERKSVTIDSGSTEYVFENNGYNRKKFFVQSAEDFQAIIERGGSQILVSTVAPFACIVNPSETVRFIYGGSPSISMLDLYSYEC